MTGGGEPSQADVQAAFCAVVCDEWVRAGVTDAVVAPGSRSTPMTAALDAEPGIAVHVVLDERSAGFVALGMASVTGRPAVVVTTSGTASVELHPAVVEASQGHVPLIAVTTDRPPELHGVGAPQTVEQHGLFGRAVRWEFDPGVAELSSSGMWRSVASRCVAEAAGPSAPGPVHLNLPFREPLVGSAAGMELPAGREAGRTWHRRVDRAPAEPPGREVLGLLDAGRGGRGLVVAGHGAAVSGLALAGALGWPLFADPRSGCRLDSCEVVAAADALLRCGRVAAEQPEIVVRLGAPWASKVLNQWLAGLPRRVPQIVVDPWGRWVDAERTATHLVRGSVGALVESVASGGPVPASEWAQRWAAREASAQSVFDGLLAPGCPLELSEPAVARACVDSAPDGAVLVVSSSMPIRDVEWFGRPRSGLDVVANRGANGIDGVVSTAVGAASARGTPTIGLVGDLAFLYDAGALLWAGSRAVRLALVVVDNDGGGIFSFLPQAEAYGTERFERYWGTPHGLDLAAVASSYGARSERVADRADLDRFLSEWEEPGIRVAIVPSDRVANVAAHERLNTAVAHEVTA